MYALARFVLKRNRDMNVTPFHCGPFANESERTAFEHLRSRIESSLGAGDDQWILLTNLTWSVTHQFQADEIDIIAIGPPGVRVIEVKHWSRRWVDEHPDLVDQEADRVTNKARKIGTTSRKSVPDLGRVDGVILLTRESPGVRELAGRVVRGVRFCTLKEWREAIDFDAATVLRLQQVARLGRLLEPRSAVALDGSLRRFAGYVNLERRTPPTDRFHRAYQGVHATRHDKVILHLYDLSASDDAHAETRATREFETLHRLQLHAWAPRVLDSWQPAPGYAGEMHFFTVTDPLAPSVEKRAADRSWDIPARLAFARAALGALGELHGQTVDNAPILHRNLTPGTVLVRHDNTPIFTGFELSRIPSEQSVGAVGPPSGEWPPSTAPEVRAQGLHAADAGSDRHALCASLRVLFEERDDETSRQAVEVLASGMADDPTQRSEASVIDARLSALLGESPPAPPPPPARFWTEDQIVPFRGGHYRVVERLGSGGVGTTFKVVQLDRTRKEDLGTYVAKVCHDEEAGRRAVSAYRLARSHLQHQAVSGIFEVASEWRENEFTALMTWVEGSPLRDFVGVLPLLVDNLDETSADALTLFWLRAMCEALDVLHRNGLIHGDVNPGNLIVSGRDLVLTDYDFVGRIDEPITAPGAVLYCSPSHQTGRPASPSDDLYALAASFFHVIFEHEPFRYDGAPAKERGLNWEAVDAEQRAEYPGVAAFLDRATDPDPDRRFQSATEALKALKAEPPVAPPPVVTPIPAVSPAPAAATESSTAGPALVSAPPATESVPVPEPSATPAPVPGPSAGQPTPVEPAEPQAVRREEHVEWLRGLLQSYPGSRWGNRETRGLDSAFAEQTYVETPLEAALLDDLRARRVRLVVLCGNAGDGKTALLQHLARRFGLERRGSSERVLEGETDDGLRVRMNLDGSASWRGRSADDLLDEFLAPFRHGPPAEDIAHLVAINDGRLLEWIERVEGRERETPLTRSLYEALQRVQQDRRTGAPAGAARNEGDEYDDEDSGGANSDAAREAEDGGEVGEDAAPRAASDAHIRFVNLNQRSLVGGVTADGTGIETGFLEQSGGPPVRRQPGVGDLGAVRDLLGAGPLQRVPGQSIVRTGRPPGRRDRRGAGASPRATLRGAPGRPPARRDARHGARAARRARLHPVRCPFLRRLPRGRRRGGPARGPGLLGSGLRSVSRTRDRVGERPGPAAVLGPRIRPAVPGAAGGRARGPGALRPGARRTSADRSPPDAPDAVRRPPERAEVSRVEARLGAAARVLRMVRTRHRSRSPAIPMHSTCPTAGTCAVFVIWRPTPRRAKTRAASSARESPACRRCRRRPTAAPASCPCESRPGPRRRALSGSRNRRIVSASKPTSRPHPPASTGCTGRRLSSTSTGMGARNVCGSERTCSTCCWN